MENEIVVLPVRDFIVPYENFLKVLILGGVPIRSSHPFVPTIDSMMINYMYNSLPNNYYEDLENNCREIEKKYKEYIIDYNRKVYSALCIRDTFSDNSLSPLLKVPKKLQRAFKYPETAQQVISNMNINPDIKKHVKGSFATLIMSTLEFPIQRQYLENAVLMDFTIEEMLAGWKLLFSSYSMKTFNPRGLDAFVYYLWDLRRFRRRSENINNMLIREYYDMDKQNAYYDIHRTLLFRGPVEFKLAFGLITTEDRELVIKKIYGKVASEVTSRLDDNRFIPPDTMELFKYADGEIKEILVDPSGEKEEYRKAIKSVISRISYASTQRKTLEDIKRVAYDKEDKEKIYVADEPITNK